MSTLNEAAEFILELRLLMAAANIAAIRVRPLWEARYNIPGKVHRWK